MRYVFVYGTLRAGEINDIEVAARRRGLPAPRWVGGLVAVPGALYDFGLYPGMVEPSPTDAPERIGPVWGDIYAIDARLEPVLDEIEEIHNGLLLKREIAVELAGARYDCLFYPVGAESVARLPWIAGGDWIRYRVARDAACAA
jgi:gamma-glutamylcyclotransferase (GGCT)/AIG2-like uncharacterized protein YtfP